MQPEAHLRRSIDFDRARSSGRRWTDSLLACYVFARDDSDPTRIGITVGKRTGNAVVRNRIKRRIREAVRPRYPEIRVGYDVVLIARPPAAQASYTNIEHSLIDFLRRAGLGGAQAPAPLDSPPE